MNIKKIFHKRLGFTLSEVLIAVTLIGIVAVLTIPTMIVSVQKHEYKSGVKKAHSLVSESFDSMKVDNDYIYKVYANGSTDISNLRKSYAQYFGFQKSSTEGRYVGYSAEHYDNMYHPLNNTNSNVNSAIYNGGGFDLRNNMTVLIGRVPKPVADSSSSSALVISVDIDGPKKGLNQLGLDIFSFEITPSDNILPMGAKGVETTSFDSTEYCITPYSGNDLNGIACTFSAVNQGEYLDDVVTSDPTGCNGKLNGMGEWDGNTFKCANQKVWNGACACNCPDGYQGNANGLCENTTTSEDKGCILVGDDKKVCCSEEKHNKYDSKKQACVCDEGYGLEDGVCKEGVCENDGNHYVRSSDNKCIACEEGVATSGNKCNCKPNYEWVEAKGECLDPCTTSTTGQIRNDTTGECECSSSKTLVGTNCCDPTTTIKVDGKSYDLALKENPKSCDDFDCGNGTYNGAKCECSKYAVFDTSSKKCVCDSAGNFTTDTSGSNCTCKEGYELVGSTCACENGSKEENCGCDASLGLVGGSATGTCQCDTSKGFSAKDGVAANYAGCTCSASHATKTDGTCKCTGNRIDADCKCDSSAHRIDTDGDYCVCDSPNGYTEENGTCKYTGCKNGATYDTTAGKCVCNLANATVSDNSCVCTYEGQTVQTNSSGNWECLCPSGQTLNTENKCVANGGTSCQTGAKNSGGGCVCQDGTVKNTVNNNEVCDCPGDLEIFTTSTATLIMEKDNADSSYIPQYCYNPYCISSGGKWTSQGGEYGDCYCGPEAAGVTWIEDTSTSEYGGKCGCEGVDAYIKDITKSYEDRTCTCGYEYEYKNADNETVTAVQNVSQLTYNTSSQTCIPNGENNKFIISDATDLQTVPKLGGAYDYLLTSDVSISDNWTPIGSLSNPFKGTFDGNNKTVTITNINMKDSDYVGFFGYTDPESGCQIANLNLVIEGTIEGKDNVGGLVGLNNCRIFNVTVTYNTNGKIIGHQNVGGMIGANAAQINPDATTTDLSSTRKAQVVTPKITGKSITVDEKIKASVNVGGAIGQNAGDVYYTGVTGGQIDTSNSPETVGGFVGLNMGSGQIELSYVDSSFKIGDSAAESITGSFIGGFVGNNTATIKNSYTQAYVKGNKVGGFAGTITNGTITNVYARPNSVISGTETGGFVGIYEDGTIKNSLYSTDGKADATSTSATLTGVTGYTNDELSTPSTYLCLEGWIRNIPSIGSPTKLDPQIWYFPQDTTSTTGYKVPQLLASDNTTTCNESVNEYIAQTTAGVMGCLAIYTSDSCTTTTTCEINQHYDVTNATCVAACSVEGAKWSEPEYVCKCPGDLVEIDAKCQCPPDTALYSTSMCIKCSNANATVATDGSGNKYCKCNTADYTFDNDIMACIPNDCTDKTGIWDKYKCIDLPTPLQWEDATTKNKAVCNTTDTSFNLSTDADLYYMSECTQTYAETDPKYIPNGSTGWTSAKTFTLANDIDMTNYSYGKPQQFRPIQAFQGSAFAGGTSSTSYKISNLTINMPTTDNVGLFAQVTGLKSQVKFLDLYNLNVTGKNNVGALIGNYACNRTSTTVAMQKINVTSSKVKGTQNIGGVIGLVTKTAAYKNPTLNRIQYTGEVNSDATTAYKGGIIGYLDFQNDSSTQYFAMQSTYATPTFQSGHTNCGGTIGGTKYEYSNNLDTTKNLYNYYTVTDTSPAKSWLGTEACISSTYQTLFQRCTTCVTSTATYSCSAYPTDTHMCPAS